MKYLLITCCFFSLSAYSQNIKQDSRDAADLKNHIYFLADDKLEGRRTGTKGEQLAYEYLIKQFKKAGLKSTSAYPNFIQPFEVKDGKTVIAASLTVNGRSLELNKDFFPMPYSGNGNFTNTNDVIVYDLKNLIEENKTNPHFDLMPALYDSVKNLKKSAAVIIINSGSVADNISFDKNDKSAVLNIPVYYITKKGEKELLEDKSSVLNGSVFIKDTSRTGHNVIGYIDNHATNTIILGAHYDHLGYGEDHNSLYVGTTPMIHNGADDNASGTAALLVLAKRLKRSSLKKYNYLFVSFSGEELGLFGSKYFTDHSPVNLSDVNYMINMDMLGRLNDSTHGLTIGGYGTSPVWSNVISSDDKYLKIKFDSSGSGPSDHTSFYRKDIPVLFFFTGTHRDYHKPTDDADKINYTGEVNVINYIYHIIEQTDLKEKIAFTKTKESATTKSSFKVSLGIMPDYTFSGNGVLVDGVSDGRPAQKAGILQGDVIYKLGEHEVHDVQTYMQALNKFDKGQSTSVFIKRGDKELSFMITF